MKRQVLSLVKTSGLWAKAQFKRGYTLARFEFVGMSCIWWS